jgi:uncharacterized protein YifE (UPF0438 family)
MPLTHKDELTVEEMDLLRRHLRFYAELGRGYREPTTDAQRHFVAVTQGRAIAETPHEFACMKYRRIQARQAPALDMATEEQWDSIPEAEEVNVSRPD